MDAGKTRGNYSSAYKLSRCTINNKAIRRERRSIEQKELRHEEINKRRNLLDLSPLQEGDATLTQDKSYKDKTPLKPRNDDKVKKGLDRLEQLKKWKVERERKRKQDEDEARRKNPVFRVSKLVAHGDTRLFGKTDTKTHPVRPKPVPVSKPSSQKVPAPHVRPAALTKPSHTSASVQSHAASRSRQTTESQTAGKQGPAKATRSSSRGAMEPAVKDKPNKKERAPVAKPKVPSTRTLRSARQAAVSAEPTSRTTRQSTREKAAESKFKAATVPKPVFEPHEGQRSSPELNLTRVTRRGDISELPSDSLSQTTDFGFNASSFVFRPLSPASAAGFLCLSQDASCASFLETNPKRSSTPKKENGQDKKRHADETAVNKTVLNHKDFTLIQADDTQVNNTATEQNDETVVASPDVKNRSVHRSRQSIKPAEKEPDAIKDEATVTTVIVEEESGNKPTPRRNPRRSVTSSVTAEEKENVSLSQKVISTPRRSLRQSLMLASSEVDDSTKSNEEVEKPRRSSQRRSTAVSSDSDSKESSDAENASPVKRRRSLRRSLMSVDSDSDNAVERKTPRGSRKSRRSVVVICEPETIQEVSEDTDTSQGNNDVFEDKDNTSLQDENKESAGPAHKNETAQKRTLSGSGADLVITTDETTPTTKKKKRSRNKSFGGFRLPDADSVVLSAKRKPRRKTLMPKSPEEWIEVLHNSPMVEMSRRKHKLGNTSLPTLNFDDIDLDEPESSVGTEEAELKATDSDSSSAVAVERNEVSPVAMETEDGANKENEPQIMKGTSDEAVVQVGEVSSTQDSPSDDSSSDTEQDVPYFRKLLCTQTNRLNGISEHWNLINDSTELTEEVHGQIRTTVGQAKLLMDQRFKQFSGLVDNCEFKLGEKETTCMDLKGFWEMIYYQVEDVDMKFAELKKLKENNWVDDKPKPVVKKVKKKVSKPVVSKPAAKSKFAAFRAQMKKQKECVSSPAAPEKKEEKVFEVPGFFTVSSPVRSPKPHCEGGTPKKATPSSEKTEEKQVSKDELALPSSEEILVNRTPARRSYLPAVPSPLLQDTTPHPRPRRTCTQRTPVPKRIIDEVDSSDVGVTESESKRVKKTPARRSLRPRKSVNFSDTISVGVVSSPTCEATDADFARLLQPMTPKDPSEDKVDEQNDSFSKYLQPLSALDTSLEKDDTPKRSRNRRSSLKGCRSMERRRSRQRSVHFASPSQQDAPHNQLPHTPYNKDSLVKQKRVSRRSHQIDDDIFSIDNIDNDENIPPPSFRSPRPSLLGTPPDMKRVPSKVTSYVPTGTLISFTP